MTAIRRLIYVANARLPTEKAHGHAIVKMCEAYAERGVGVQLWHARRQQDPALARQTVFEYYGVPETFRVRTLRNVDLVPLERRLPASVHMAVMTAGAYGAVQSGTYNTRPLVPEVLVKGDRYAVVRPRIDVDALIAMDKLAPWL